MMRTPPNADVFNALVWDIVRQVPPGKVTTYGQVASMLPPMDGIDPVSFDRLGAQWVGGAMNVCPADVPWQRVINSKGESSLAGPTGARQWELLESEGVQFDAKGRVNFEVYAWDGPDADWLDANGVRPPTSLKKKKNMPTQPTLF